MAIAQKPLRPSDKYTAVIFVHGMGQQTRHKNVGELLDALERYTEFSEEAALRSFKARTEPSRVGERDDVPFMQFDRFDQRKHKTQTETRWRFAGRYRAYEAYWSPVTARGAAPWPVALWALGRLNKPAEILKHSWRHATRLRMARLHKLIAETPTPEDPAQARGLDYVHASLLALIQRFRGHDGERHESEHQGEPMDAKAFRFFAMGKLDAPWWARLFQAVKDWDEARLPVETAIRDVAHRLRVVGPAIGAYFVALGVRSTLDRGANVLADILLAVIGFGLIWAGLKAGKFLSLTFSDVFIWNSNRDHDREFARRQDVLSRTRALIEHVVADPACKRVVIVAHSLGTAITLETLSHIGRRNEARAGGADLVELSKLSHLFTLGSPIDKIFYFFQTDQPENYRAGRLYDDLRGDLSGEPFFRNGRGRVQWLNVWDEADIVSDPLYSPLGHRTDGADILTAEIHNCQVENTRGFDPVNSHLDYLDNPNVAESIGNALFHDRVTPPGFGWRRRGRGLLQAQMRVLERTPTVLWVAAALTLLDKSAFGLLVIALLAAVFGFDWFKLKRAEKRRGKRRFTRPAPAC